jgi:hypothetical protein
MRLTTHYLVPVLRMNGMSGAIPPLPLYAFMACKGTPLLYIIFKYRKFCTVMHEFYALDIPLQQLHVYIFVSTNALSVTFFTADALCSSHNKSSRRISTLLLNFRPSSFAPIA